MSETGCPKPLQIVTYFLEGGSPDGLMDGHVRACPACSAQIQELEADRKAFLVKHPFSSFMADLEKRRPARTGLGDVFKRVLGSGVLRAAVAMAGVATLMIVVIGRYDRTPEILSKGGVDLRFYVGGAAGRDPEPGSNGMKLPPESAVQFVYSTSADQTQLLLVGVEQNGALSVYYPSGGTGSATVEAGDQKKLPQALRWQPKTDYERFYAIFSKDTLTLDAVRKALDQLKTSGKSVEQTARLPLPYPQASTILYRKAP
ncbi:MAG TPA: hypothetical protein VFX30_04950 [bacterium]|nr:hypothetical protein [bacterium]